METQNKGFTDRYGTTHLSLTAISEEVKLFGGDRISVKVAPHAYGAIIPGSLLKYDPDAKAFVKLEDTDAVGVEVGHIKPARVVMMVDYGEAGLSDDGMIAANSIGSEFRAQLKYNHPNDVTALAGAIAYIKDGEVKLAANITAVPNGYYMFGALEESVVDGEQVWSINTAGYGFCKEVATYEVEVTVRGTKGGILDSTHTPDNTGITVIMSDGGSFFETVALGTNGKAVFNTDQELPSGVYSVHINDTNTAAKFQNKTFSNITINKDTVLDLAFEVDLYELEFTVKDSAAANVEDATVVVFQGETAIDTKYTAETTGKCSFYLPVGEYTYEADYPFCARVEDEVTLTTTKKEEAVGLAEELGTLTVHLKEDVTGKVAGVVSLSREGATLEMDTNDGEESAAYAEAVFIVPITLVYDLGARVMDEGSVLDEVEVGYTFTETATLNFNYLTVNVKTSAAGNANIEGATVEINHADMAPIAIATGADGNAEFLLLIGLTYDTTTNAEDHDEDVDTHVFSAYATKNIVLTVT